MTIINLKISTWQGISLGAEHFYVELQGKNKSVELYDVLTKRQAVRLNKKDYATGYSFDLYSPGDKFRGFDTRDEAIASGKKEWLNHFPDAVFLVLGNRTHCEPKLLLDSTLDDDSELKARIRKIFDKCDAIGFFDDPKNDDLMDKHCEEWETLLNIEVEARQL